MATMVGLLVLLTMLSLANGHPYPGEPLEFAFEGNENCEGFEGKIRLENLLVEKLDRNHVALTGDFVMDIPIDENLKIRATLTKCPTKTETSKCEDFPPNDVHDACEKLPKKNETWSTFVEKLEGFNPHCSVKPGRYHFERYPEDMSNLASMPKMQGYWIIKSEGFVDNKKVLCVTTEASFNPAKIKKKKTG